MLNTLAAAIPGGQRVISVEEVYELGFRPGRVLRRHPFDEAL